MHCRLSLLPLLSLIILAMGELASSCALMHDVDDEEDCPTEGGLYVRFVYDYNIDRADMMRAQVGDVMLWVWDDQGRLVARRDVRRPVADAPIATVAYVGDTRFHLLIDDLPAGRYRLLALAYQRPYDEVKAEAGAKFRIDDPVPAAYTDLGVTLDRTPLSGTRLSDVPHGGQPLDTLWHGQATEYSIPATALTLGTQQATADYVEVRADRPTYATVRLVRDMNELHVSLHSVNPADTLWAADYDITVTDVNGHLGWDGTPLPDDTLRYVPYATWTAIATPAGGSAEGKAAREAGAVSVADGLDEGATVGHFPSTAATSGNVNTRVDEVSVIEQAAHYDFCLSRLIYNDEPARCAVMRVVHRPSGREVAVLNLPHLLCAGRSHPLTMSYGPQEFLDREHRYSLTLVMTGSGPEQRLSYISLSISILGWTKRIQYAEL